MVERIYRRSEGCRRGTKYIIGFEGEQKHAWDNFLISLEYRQETPHDLSQPHYLGIIERSTCGCEFTSMNDIVANHYERRS